MLGVISAIAGAALGGSTPFSPNKAVIEVEKFNNLAIGSIALPHMLNPTDLKVGRKVTWNCAPTSKGEGSNSKPFYTFSGGGDTLSFSVVFDCSEEPNKGLLEEIEAMYDLTYPFSDVKTGDAPAGKRAQLVRFGWESFLFLGVVESVDVTVNLFDSEGRMKRATVGISMKGEAFSKRTVDDVVPFFTADRTDRTAPKYKKGPNSVTPAVDNPLAAFGI